MTQNVSLPGEDPLIPSRSNYDSLSSKPHSDVRVMGQGVSDEAIVVIKPVADEGAVTHLRVKPQVSSKEARGEGRNTLTERT